jgi:hypothetical protein
MTTTFDEREKAFERQFAQAEEQRFHARNRRNRLLAAWAGERMRLSGRDAEDYVAGFIDAGVVIGDEALLAKLLADLTAAGIAASLPDLRLEMDRCAAGGGGLR